VKLFLWVNEMQLTPVSKQKTMTSREIAELAAVPHESVLKTVRRLIAEGIVFGNDTPYTHPQNGQTYVEFHLSFRDTMVIISGYNVELRAKIIDRWQELENSQPAPRELTRMELLQIAMDAEREKEAALALANHAIATKAEIGSRREATAMNTASQAVKKAQALEIELDKSKQYSSIKRMEMLHHGLKFDWRKLKSTGLEMGVEPIEIFDANYGTVKAYHADVWMETYALSIE